MRDPRMTGVHVPGTPKARPNLLHGPCGAEPGRPDRAGPGPASQPAPSPRPSARPGQRRGDVIDVLGALLSRPPGRGRARLPRVV